MTDRLGDTIGEGELAWWCQGCRSARIVHCSEPERCGEMREIPYVEAKLNYDALRARTASSTREA